MGDCASTGSGTGLSGSRTGRASGNGVDDGESAWGRVCMGVGWVIENEEWGES